MFRVLDSIGYSDHMVQVRRMAWRMWTDVYTEGIEAPYRLVTAGSKGEGLTKLEESDWDIVHIHPYILCIDDLTLLPPVPDSTTHFAMKYTSPGYCILELVRWGNKIHECIFKSMVIFRGTYVLSSSVFSSEMESIMPVPSMFSVKKTGPAITQTYDAEMSYDNVHSISFDCSHILQKRLGRNCENDWPPGSVREVIKQMKGNLVATGIKSSETRYLEWRLCFNEIELLLVESFNDTQLKLYTTLKMINTGILKACGCSVTSYMMKNIVFWLAEQYPQSAFRSDTLFTWIIKGLRVLEYSAKVNFLPYFIIPERNLLAEKVSESERTVLVNLVSHVIKCGPSVLLQCEKVSQAMRLDPQDLALLGKKNRQLECTSVMGLLHHQRLITQGHSEESCRDDVVLRRLDDQMRRILSSGWPSSMEQTLRDCTKNPETSRVLFS